MSVVRKLIESQHDKGNLRIYFEGELLEAGAGVSRIFRHFTSKSPNVDSAVIISASRDAGNPEMASSNKKKTSAMKADVKKMGLGYIKGIGVWTENEGKPDERTVREKVLIIQNISLKQGMKLCKKYEQESFIYWDKEKNKIRAYDEKGVPQDWSKWSSMKFKLGPGDIQTQVKGKPRKSFAFAASQDQKKGDLEMTFGEAGTFSLRPKRVAKLHKDLKEFLDEE